MIGSELSLARLVDVKPYCCLSSSQVPNFVSNAVLGWQWSAKAQQYMMLQDHLRVIACVELITLVSNPKVNTLNASTRVAHTRLVEMFFVTFALCLVRYEVSMSARHLEPERGYERVVNEAMPFQMNSKRLQRVHGSLLVSISSTKVFYTAS